MSFFHCALNLRQHPKVDVVKTQARDAALTSLAPATISFEAVRCARHWAGADVSGVGHRGFTIAFVKIPARCRPWRGRPGVRAHPHVEGELVDVGLVGVADEGKLVVACAAGGA